jgi:hypothetical protein
MINTLRVASGGYLKKTSIVSLTIAVDGYLGKTVITPPIEEPKWGANNKVWEQKYEISNIELLDAEIIEIVKITLKHFIL